MNLFVYGTLLSPAKMAEIIGRIPGNPIPAQLNGYVVSQNRYGDPAIYPAGPEEHVSGLVWLDITPAERLALDEYESPDDGSQAYLLTQVTVQAAAGDMKVWTYVGHLDGLPDEAEK